MTDEDIGFMPASQMVGLIKSKELSPVEVTKALLRRIDALEPQVNAFSYIAGDEALQSARKAEDAVMRGDELGPLHGVPVTIKDLTWTKDFPTYRGSWIPVETTQTVETPHVSRLRESGSVLMGKTTTSEFGWTGVSRNPRNGITHNPWKHGYNAGASSSGAGAATAAGFGPLHQGSDGAGSIRMPAHFCGVYGLKPTYGRVPFYPTSPEDTTPHIGPLTRTVEDAALMMKVIAGPSYLDHTSLEGTPPDYPRHLHADIKPKRIKYSANLGHLRVDPEVAAIVRSAAEQFASAVGFEMEDVEPTWGPKGTEIAMKMWSAHTQSLAGYLDQWADKMDPGLVACVRDCEGMSVVEYQSLRERKYAYVAEIHSFFETCDFLITPTVSVAAFPAKQLQPDHWPQHPWDWITWAGFSYPFNMAWNPAASVPCGFTSDGLPVGLQIVGKRFDDLGVLQASAAFERAMPWAHLRPPLKN